MKNALKTLGFLLIVAAAFLIASCGPPVEPEETFTVTFDSNGGTTVPAQSGIAKDGLVTSPKPPTWVGTKLTTEALYKDVTSNTTFKEWQKDGVAYSFGTPVTESFTLKAEWNNPPAAPSPIDLSAYTKSTIVEKAVDYINAQQTVNPGDSWTLALATAQNPDAQIKMNKGNLKIISTSNGQREIKGFKNTGTVYGSDATGSNPKNNYVAFIIGDGTNTVKLTLNSVALVGCGSEVGDSLVRVQKNATLTLENNTAIKGHINNTTRGSGNNGNGSAVCIVGGTLIMGDGSVIEDNESTGVSANRNLVGGVYTIAADSTTGPTLKITGGQIIENKCKDGQTKDVYATEGGSFELGGNVRINEITINGDDRTGVNAPLTTVNSTAGNIDRAVITVSSLEDGASVKLSLRSTASTVDIVKDKVWINQSVLIAPATGTLNPKDVAKFSLLEFKWYGTGTQVANLAIGTGFKISDDGKFIVAPTPPPEQ